MVNHSNEQSQMTEMGGGCPKRCDNRTANPKPLTIVGQIFQIPQLSPMSAGPSG